MTRRRLRAALARAAAQADVILSTGGASRGEADHMVAAMLAMGKLHAWQLAVKPGRPLAIGEIGDTVFLGLPGNPVAVFTTFLLYCQPMLARLSGAAWRPPQRFPVAAGFRFAGQEARPAGVLARLDRGHERRARCCGSSPATARA